MSALPHWPQTRDIHLVVSSLGAMVVDAPGVRSVRAEDASGGFGLWPGHVDFLTVLSVGVLSWRQADDTWQHCAVRRGVLTMRRGCALSIATREAVLCDDLDQLEHQVLAQLRQRQDAEDTARRESRQLEVRALRELVRPHAAGGRASGGLP